MIVRLPYARDERSVDLDRVVVETLRPSVRPSKPTAELVADAVDGPLDGPPLENLAKGRANAVLIVPDATRRIDLPRVIPVLVERLARAGIPEGSIRVLVANGTHPPAEPAELAALVGASSAVRVEQHDCRDSKNLVRVGELRPGLPLRLNRLAVETELLITVGSLRHHYFAGFGGGPKMVFPGVAGYEEIQANHALVLERTSAGLRRSPGCEPGLLDGNPVADEIARAADARPPDMSLCLVPGNDDGFAWAGAGPWRETFGAAVERVRDACEIPARRFRLVVATGGGAPADSTLIQAHKGFDAAYRFLEPGGALLYVAAIDQGAGSAEMQPFLDDPHPQAILERLSERWVQYGHTTLRLVEKTSGCEAWLHSELDPGLAGRLGFRLAPNVDSVIDDWRRRFPGETVGVLDGDAVYPRTV